jgi:hypothetical protein
VNSVQIWTGCGGEQLVSHAWCYSVSRTVLLFVILPLPARYLTSTFIKSQSVTVQFGIFIKYPSINYSGS